MTQTACKTLTPVDAFIASLPKRAHGCVVGVCSLDPLSKPPVSTIAALEICRAWSLHAQRRSCVISPNHSIRTEEVRQQDPLDWEPKLRSWNWLGQPDFPADFPAGSFSGLIANDVAGLVKLKFEYGLILIELGSIDSPMAQFASKLCEGLVLLADSSPDQPIRKNLRPQLRLLQRPDCKWLGYWGLKSNQKMDLS